MPEETTFEPAVETAPCLTCEVLAVDEGQALAEVRFLNPDHTGTAPVTYTRTVPGPDDEDGQPTSVEQTYQVDEDPNPHVVKSVRVPLDDDGLVDQVAWQQRLIEQARGVKARMVAAQAPTPVPGALDVLLGDN